MKGQATRETAQKLMLLLGGTVVGIVLCVIIVTIAFPAPSRFYVHPPGLHRTFTWFPGMIPGVEGEKHFVINSQGMRGDEFSEDQDYRILAIGGSTTFGMAHDETEVWTRLVQDYLNEHGPKTVCVGNAGRIGLTTRVHTVQLKHLLPQHPRPHAVLLLIGINDLLLRLAQGNAYDPGFMNRDDVESLLMARAFSIYPDMYREEPSYKRTAIWRFTSKAAVRLRQDAAQGQAEPLRTHPRWRDKRRRASAILDELPDLSSALDEYARNVSTTIDLARAHSVRPIFLTQPSLWRDGLSQQEKDLLWTGGTGDYTNEPGHAYYSPEALATAMEQYNERLLQVCRERNVECFDLATHIPKGTSAFYDDCHFNEAGMRLVAEALGRYLARRPPFKSQQ